MAALGKRSIWTLSVTASFLLHAGLALAFSTAISFGTVPQRETRISMESIDPSLPLGDASEPVRRDTLAPEPPPSADRALETADATAAGPVDDARTDTRDTEATPSLEPDTLAGVDTLVQAAERPEEETRIAGSSTPEAQQASTDGEATAPVEVAQAAIPDEAETAPLTRVSDAEIVADGTAAAALPGVAVLEAPNEAPPTEATPAAGSDVEVAAAGNSLREAAASPIDLAAEVADSDTAEVLDSSQPASPDAETDNVADAASTASTEPLQAVAADLAPFSAQQTSADPVGASDSLPTTPALTDTTAVTPSLELPEAGASEVEVAAAASDPAVAVVGAPPADAVGSTPDIVAQPESVVTEVASDGPQLTLGAIAPTVALTDPVPDSAPAAGLTTTVESAATVPASAPSATDAAAPADEAPAAQVAVAPGAADEADPVVDVAAAPTATAPGATEIVETAPVAAIPADGGAAETVSAPAPAATIASTFTEAATIDAATPAVASLAVGDVGDVAEPEVAVPVASTATPGSALEVGSSLTPEAVLNAFASPVDEAASVGDAPASPLIGSGGDALEASAPDVVSALPAEAAAPVETALLSPGSSSDALATPSTAPVLEAEPVPQSPEDDGAEQQTADLPAVQSAPPATPEQAQQDAATEARRALQVRIASVVDYLVGYDGGACFVAFPELNSKGDLRLSAFAADTAIGTDLGSRLSSTVGFDVPVATSAISQPQCSALRFTQLIGDPRARRPIRIVLDRVDVTNGEPLSGRILGGSGEPIHLLIVDDEGAVQNVDRYVTQDEAGITFDPPVFLTSGAVSTVQLLVAVASRQELDTIVRLKKTEADGFFSMLTSEMRNMQLKATVAVAAFNVR